MRLIVPFAPGGSTDAMARIIANRLSEVWGQQMVVENRGGGSSNIGHEAVVRSEPDGHTVLIGSLPLAVNRFLFRALAYDPMSDLAPVTLICTYPNVMTVPNSSPAKSVMEFIAHAKANSGKISYASAGNGTSVHLSGELFKRATGIEMTHIPYRGGGPGAQRSHSRTRGCDVQYHRHGAAAGEVRTAARPRGDHGRALPHRSRAADDRGIGSAGLRRVLVVCIFRAGSDAAGDVIGKFNADTAAVLAEPAIRDRMEALGVAPQSSTPAALAAHLRAEIDKWGPVIRQAGISVTD